MVGFGLHRMGGVASSQPFSISVPQQRQIITRPPLSVGVGAHSVYQQTTKKRLCLYFKETKANETPLRYHSFCRMFAKSGHSKLPDNGGVRRGLLSNGFSPLLRGDLRPSPPLRLSPDGGSLSGSVRRTTVLICACIVIALISYLVPRGMSSGILRLSGPFYSIFKEF